MVEYNSPPPAYDPPLSSSHRRSRSDSQSQSSPSLPNRRQSFQPRPRIRSKPSILDEILPLPIPSSAQQHMTPTPVYPVIRRISSLAIVVVFLVSTVFLASTEDGVGSLGSGVGLKKVFGFGSEVGFVGQDLQEVGTETETAATTTQSAGMPLTTSTAGASGSRPHIDFEKYTLLNTISSTQIDLSEGKRLIFIGDIHGSLAPLERLMSQINYHPANDRLIHVGDLIAKGDMNDEVLVWMNRRRIQGVRGNHDQPVIQWRTWMEWAGGEDWEGFVDGLGENGDEEVLSVLSNAGKMYPKDWEWKGEHWKIARNLQTSSYKYLVQLPLLLHIPSLHTIVVHAGLLPHDPSRSFSHPSQPLVGASLAHGTTNVDLTTLRSSEEMALIFDVPQNRDPWTLLNMRSIYTKGKKKGQVIKSAKKGTPWSDVWKDEMGRCQGEGKWVTDGQGEWAAEHEVDEDGDGEVEGSEEGEVDELSGQDGLGDQDEVGDQGRSGDPGNVGKRRKSGKRGTRDDALPNINCSPVTVVYGHAASRGLQIKPFSKGIDTGCVYGRKLTALVLGDITGLEGEAVRLDDQEGVLVSVDCGKGGT